MKFSIGQVSKMFNISTDTLRHYDKIDILKPKVNPNNKYRYYSVKKLEKLDLILGMKNLGIPLKDIKNLIESEDLIEYKKLIEEHEKTIFEKITTLEKLKENLDNGKNIIDRVLNFKNNYDFSTLKPIEKTFSLVRIKNSSLTDFNNYDFPSEIPYVSNDTFIYSFNITTDQKVNENEMYIFFPQTPETLALAEKYKNHSRIDIIKTNITKMYINTQFYGREQEYEEYILKLNKYFRNSRPAHLFIQFAFYLPKKDKEEMYFIDINLKI